MTAAIDVTLPYYGDVDLMKRAVRSVLDQSFPNWRLIVVDDRYPNPEPARWFAALDDPRVTYLRNTTTLGANGNYRKCLTLVSAPTLLVMGADDVMLPGHLALITKVFNCYPHASVVQTGVQVIDEQGVPLRPLSDRVKSIYAPPMSRRTELTSEAFAVSLLRGNWTYFPSIGLRTETIRSIGFRVGLDVVQDLALLLDVARGGNTLVFDPEVTFQYRRHSKSDSSKRAVDGSRFDEERNFFSDEARKFDQIGWARAARVARWHVSSRLNAVTLMPKAVRTAGWPAMIRLGRHVLR